MGSGADNYSIDDITPEQWHSINLDGLRKPGSALSKQVNGNHYKDLKIQPIEFIHANNLDFLTGNVIKYVTRHKLKNGKQDLEKAIHYLELLIELEYK